MKYKDIIKQLPEYDKDALYEDFKQTFSIRKPGCTLSEWINVPFVIEDVRIRDFLLNEVFTDGDINDWIRINKPANPANPTYSVVIDMDQKSYADDASFTVHIEKLLQGQQFSEIMHSENISSQSNFGKFYFSSEKEAKKFATLFKLTFSLKYGIDVK